MKKALFITIFSVLSLNGYSQIIFENGYFINNSDEKINCLIKNIDWKNNPTKFEYKLSEDSESKIEIIDSVKEFAILNVALYRRFKLNIDKSSDDVRSISANANPEYREEVLFLKTLIEGKATLYFYEEGNVEKYFYSLDDTSVQQLVFKLYKNTENKVFANNEFKHQLWNNLSCKVFSLSDIGNISYDKSDLIDFFIKYNQCKNSEFVNHEKKIKTSVTHLAIRPGVNLSSLSIRNSYSNLRNTDFDDEYGFRLGIEVEYTMPFNKNKWTILMEPTYQYYKSLKDISTEIVGVDYKSIEFPIGIRHYFFLNDVSRVFINCSYSFDVAFNSRIFFDNGYEIVIETGSNLVFGFGYKYHDKYSFELRYNTSRSILVNYVSWGSNFSTTSIIFGYRIF